jgi:ABC-type transport system substrate-binding protein
VRRPFFWLRIVKGGRGAKPGTDAPGDEVHGCAWRTPRIADHPSTATQRRPSGFHQELSPATTRIEELRATWLDTADLEQQKRICVDLQKQLWEDVPFIPLGEYWQATAYRKDLTDVLPGCFAVFYGVRRA